MPYTVLLVDDEPNVLAGLQRALRKEPYLIFSATSAEMALVVLQARTVDVVISDQDMPGMRGADFLAKVRQEFPDTVRFMLTGKPTLEVALQAINAGAISRFFTKPCNPLELAITIKQALHQRALMLEAKRLLRVTRKQPPPSSTWNATTRVSRRSTVTSMGPSLLSRRIRQSRHSSRSCGAR